MAKKSITKNDNTSLTEEQLKLVYKYSLIVTLLVKLKQEPSSFLKGKGRVIYSEFFKTHVISQKELLAWHNKNHDWDILTKEVLEQMIESSIGFVGQETVPEINKKTGEKERIKYYCLLV